MTDKPLVRFEVEDGIGVITIEKLPCSLPAWRKLEGTSGPLRTSGMQT